jgi:ATP-dependent DNA helicase RecG
VIERYGSGIHRILQACQEADLPEPLFENFSGGFRIKFVQAEKEEATDLSKVPLNGALNGTLNERIGALIKKQPGIQRKELIEQTGASVRTVARVISELLSGGEIERRGSKKTGGYWPL